MPKMVKVTETNVSDLFTLIKMPENFSKPDSNPRESIKKDIPRSSFLNSNGQTVTDFNKMWLQVDDNAATTYSQGFMSGSILKIIQNHYFMMLHDAFTNAKDNPHQPNLPNGISFDHNSPNYYFKSELFTVLDFAFYDTDPNDSTKLVPCALSIYCLKDNPDYWYMGVIKPTTAISDKQRVYLIAPKELTYYEGEDLADASTAIDELMAEIHTDKIKDLLHGIFLPAGQVNVEKLTELKELIHPKMTQDENDAVDLISQISALEKQMQTEDVKTNILTLQLSLAKKQTDIIKHKIAEQEESARRLLLKRQQEAKEQEEKQRIIKQQEEAKEHRRIIIRNVALIAGVILLAVGIALALFFTGGFAAIVPAGVAVLIHSSALIATLAVTAAAATLTLVIGIMGALGVFGNFVKDTFFPPLKKTESSSSLEMQDSLPPTSPTNSLSNLGGSVAPPPPDQNNAATDGNTPPPTNSNRPDNAEEDHDKPSPSS